MNDLIERIAVTTGVEPKRIYRPGRTIDVPTSVLDVTRANEVFGWETKIDLTDGLQSYCAWMRAHLIEKQGV